MAPLLISEYTPEGLLGPLNDIERKNAPDFLYASGDVGLCHRRPRVAVIGTREVSDRGIRQTEKLVKMLVDKGATVVSGLARGVDTWAHKTAIRHGGRTIAVLGTPIDKAYPRENEPLQDEIIADHLVITQFKAGQPVHKSNFPRRNRTMALVSDATIIVEAGETSGTLHQGWEALRLGRPLFLLKTLAGRPDLHWPKKMLDYGAQILSDEDKDSFFDHLPQSGVSDSTILSF